MKSSFWRRWSHSLLSARPTRPILHTRPRRNPIGLEALEDRVTPSLTPLMVADINPGAAFSFPSQVVAIGSTTYFTADDGVHGQELWKSDGTAAGTTLVKDFNPGTAYSFPRYLTNVNGTLFFTADDGAHGPELWKSDGTEAGTTLVKDIFPGGGGSSPADLTNVNGTLFFAANDGAHGHELWKSDGTAAGTTLVKDIRPGGGTSWLGNPTAVNGTLFFAANDGAHGPELWKSDGTEAGTTLVKDIFPGGFTGWNGGYYLNSSYPSNLTNVNGTLFLTASGALWKTDGTPDGTVPVSPVAYSPSNLTSVNGTLFFTQFDDVNGDELWKSDGTAAGTTLVKDIFPGGFRGGYGGFYLNSSYPSNLTNANGTLFFTAYDGTSDGLWKSDGTEAGTVMVMWSIYGPSDLTDVNGTLFFTTFDSWPQKLWQSDGTEAGTEAVGNFANLGASKLTNVNGTWFFVADDGVHGQELWTLVDDGQTQSTSLEVSGFPATVTAGAGGSFTVTVKYADGTLNTNYRGTVHFASSDPQAVLPADYTFTADDQGTHTFAATLKTAGTQSITASDAAVGITGADGGITVTPAAASRFAVGGFPPTVTAGAAGRFTVIAVDAYGNRATGYTGTVRFTSSDPQAVVPGDSSFTAADAGMRTFSATLKTAGTQSIAATDVSNGAITGTQGSIQVNAAAASRFLLSAPARVKAGTQFSLTVTVVDAYGNVLTGYRGTLSFRSSDSTAKLPKNYKLTAADQGARTFTGLVLKKKGKQTITVTDTLNSSLTASALIEVL